VDDSYTGRQANSDLVSGWAGRVVWIGETGNTFSNLECSNTWV